MKRKFKENCSIRKIIKNNSTNKFIIVNNGSTDNSINIIKELNKHYFKSIHLKNNIGYGGGILEGIKKDKGGEIVSWTHGDIQCDFNDVIIAYNKYKNELKNNLCIIKGRRINRKFINYFSR